MWRVLEHRTLPKQLRKVPVTVLKRYEKWKDIVCLSGPNGLRLIKGFRDESLLGDWHGFRSSRLSQKYRVIYKVEADNILVKVIKVTNHDYRQH